MGKFNEYTQKATPEDADSLMIYDAAAKVNKLSPFNGIWNWIVEKLTNAVISNLQTNNRTVLGAINELNSNPLNTLTRNAILLEQAFDYNELKTTGAYYLNGGEVTKSNNRPNDNCTNCYLLILANRPTRVTQIVFPGNYPYISYRSLNTDTDTWNEWKTTNSKTSKLALEENVTNIQALISKASSGTCILFHLSGANYAGNDLPIGEKYKYGSGIIFYRNSNSCKIVLFPEEMKPVWKMANWAKWKDFANNIVD